MPASCPSCKAKGLADDFRFCPYCGVEVKKTTACPQCGHDPGRDVKFCPECGARLDGVAPSAKRTKAATPKAGILELEPPPGQGITVEFLYSTSSSFEFALQAAQALPNYRQYGEGKKAVHRVTFDLDSMDNALELADYLKGWRRRTVYVDGEKVPWQSVFGFAWCYNKRKGSYRPEFYCFGYEETYQLNVWGCLQLGLPFRENADWCTWGRWLNKKADWQFDKERMRHELQKNMHKVRFCPMMRPEVIEQVLDAFPERVNPKRDGDWKFVRGWDEAAPGLVLRITEYGYTESVKMVGVAPSGMGALQKIMKQIKGLRLPPPPTQD